MKHKYSIRTTFQSFEKTKVINLTFYIEKMQYLQGQASPNLGLSAGPGSQYSFTFCFCALVKAGRGAPVSKRSLWAVLSCSHCVDWMEGPSILELTTLLLIEHMSGCLCFLGYSKDCNSILYMMQNYQVNTKTLIS